MLQAVGTEGVGVKHIVSVGFEKLWHPFVDKTERQVGIFGDDEQALCQWGEDPALGMFPCGVVVEVEVGGVVTKAGQQPFVLGCKMAEGGESVLDQIAFGIGYKAVEPVESRHEVEAPLGGVAAGIHGGKVVPQGMAAGRATCIEEEDHFVVYCIGCDVSDQLVGGEEGGHYGLGLCERELGWVVGMAVTMATAARTECHQKGTE